ncbi:protein NtpR-like [Prunus yedoensis var. nudiflora]|uniref:Protein NtpR-like n=1 Tax=Prunus yedoensis var. nudiflora TaxID=2094558 RepID=A0A314YCV4_PRUYE|nr:protein NtpR-like [Prunus yedoensis var. nudiflora]
MPDSDEFDYPGCPSAYQEFVKATIAYKNKVNSSTSVPQHLKLDGEMGMKGNKIVRSFSIHIQWRPRKWFATNQGI